MYRLSAFGSAGYIGWGAHKFAGAWFGSIKRHLPVINPNALVNPQVLQLCGISHLEVENLSGTGFMRCY
jgi:hypothetical protein